MLPLALDAKRPARRLLGDDLILSLVLDLEQRMSWTMTRGKFQLVRERIRLQNWMEGLD